MTESLAAKFGNSSGVPASGVGGSPVGALAGGGEMGTRVRAQHWAGTALGAVATWPPSWHTVVNLCLSSDFPMTITWGPEFTQVYNDAYIPLLGAKHPVSLNKTFDECWAEVWDVLGPMAKRAMTTGEPSFRENMRMDINRYGYVEEAFFTYSFSPIRDETGHIAGLFHPVKEVTREVLAERRVRVLRDLAARVGESDTAERACATMAETLGNHRADVSFALLYLLDASGKRAHLAGTMGLEAGKATSPEPVDLTAPELPGSWPLAAAARAREPVVVTELESRFGPLPGGPWPELSREAVVLSLWQPGSDVPAGLLVAGVSPRRPFDDNYRGFFELLVGHVATAIANARAFEAGKRRAEALAELDRLKTAFFSNVSHEFRTPLTLMLGPLEEVLARPDGMTAAVRDDLVVAHRNALRLLKLVNSLLEFSRIEAGRVQAVYEPTNLADFTAELASSFRSACERFHLVLVVDAPSLADEIPLAFVDRDMWETVVFNLLSNSLKHTFEGEITVAVRERDDHVELVVRDTGIGIPAEQVPRIFERFHRVPNARSRTHEGTGIGLALVQELVRLHGGTIGLESEEGAGTTFTVRIPLGSAHLPPERVGAIRDRASTALGAAPFVEEALRWTPSVGELGGIDEAIAVNEVIKPPVGQLPVPVDEHRTRVLLADDNADMRDYLTRLLRERGWAVEAVADGRAALRAARERVPDLILTDVMMPGLDGLELLAALRDDVRTHAIPVVLLSARAGEEARVEGMRAGADDYLVKPFAARELVARVETQLRRAQKLAEERRGSEEQQRTLAAIEAERGRLRELFAQAPSAIAVFRGPAHVCEIANPHFLRFVGNRDIVGKPVRLAFPEAEGQGIFELLDGVLLTGTPFIGNEFRAMLDHRHNGIPEERFYNFVNQPIRETDGSVSGICVHAVDVTEMVQARRDAETARAAAENANRAKGDFLASMSHELRTPLNAIGGHVQLVELGVYGPVTEGQRDALARTQKSQKHLLSLITDVLNFAKLEAGRVEYDLEDVSLADIASEVLSMVGLQFEAKGLACDVRVPSTVMARADREKVQQILINLLSNAAKFTLGGGRIVIDAPAREHRPETRQDDPRPADDSRAAVFLRVSDTGIGIPREKQDAIFDPFVQVHRNLTRTTEGTGLGLAISRDLARAMGGELRVRSAEGRGSTFTLSLPRAAVSGGVTARDSGDAGVRPRGDR